MPNPPSKIDVLDLLSRIQEGEFTEEEKGYLESLLLSPPVASGKPSYKEFCAWFETAHEAKNGYVSTGDPMFYGQMQNAKAWAWAACEAFAPRTPGASSPLDE